MRETVGVCLLSGEEREEFARTERSSRPALRGRIGVLFASGALLLGWSCGSGAGEGAPPGEPQPGSGAPPGDEEPPPPQPIGPYEVGEVLARLELGAPTTTDFILRGTIPLPPRVHPLPGGLAAFALRAPDGAITAAQVETVSRYAAAEDGADVVELIAKVQRPPGFGPGARLSYEVLWWPHESAELELHQRVAELLEQPFGLTLRSRDVFGHVYRADPLRDLRTNGSELRVLRDGAVAFQARTHETMRPNTTVPGEAGTLPHFFGVHAFVTLWEGEPFFSLDLRFHNGHDGVLATDSTDDPLGKMYFRELELVLPDGWEVLEAYPDPHFGTAYAEDGKVVQPLVTPLSDGTLHMVPQQGQFHRRLMITRGNTVSRARLHLAERGLAFCQPGTSEAGRELFSWWNPQTARYFPQREPLAELWHLGAPYLRSLLEDRFRVYESTLTQGTAGPWPIITGNLGWSHPWGLKIGYAHGGEEIYFYDGVRTAYAASNEGYRYFQVVHRMMSERHPVALYDTDGEAFSFEDWIVQGPNGPYVPTYIWTWPVLYLNDPFGFLTSPSFQRDAVEALGLKPAYEATLLEYEPIDRAHLVRYTRSPKVLAWLGNDALAKDDLRMQGELMRISYTILPQDQWGGGIYTGLLEDRKDVDANPGQGFAIHRDEGWGIDTMTTAYCLAEPEWRAKVRPWFDDVLDIVEDGQSDCTGIIIGDPNLDTFHGDYRARQSISAAILQNGLWGMLRSVFGESDPESYGRLAEVLRKDIYAMISPLVWDETSETPWFYVALGPYDLTLPEFCGDYPPDGFEGNDAYQTWSIFAYGYTLTEDPIFLEYAARMLWQPLSTPALGTQTYGALENRSALMALVQRLFE